MGPFQGSLLRALDTNSTSSNAPRTSIAPDAEDVLQACPAMPSQILALGSAAF